MPGRLLIAAIVLLLAGSGSSFAQPADHWRVTVQDVSLHPLAVSADGKLVAGRGNWAQAIFYVVDYEKSQVLLSVPMSHAIRAAAFSPDGQWCIVSTYEHVYRIDLKDASSQLLIEKVAGAVAIDATGEQLAVLGDLNLEFPVSPSYETKQTQLGIWDLKQSQWKTKIDTPIKVDHLVVFDGDSVIGAGVGGRIRTRSGTGSFPCHVQFHVTTGKKSYGIGEGGDSLDYGAPENPLGTPIPDYEFPPAIKRLQAGISAVTPRTPVEQAKFTAQSNGLTGSVWALVADNQRIAAVMDHGDQKRSLLTIPITGNLTASDAKVPYDIEVCRGRIVQELQGRVTDIETGQQVTRFPDFPRNRDRDNRWDQFIGTGWLIRDGVRMSYYVPGHQGPVWERECPEGLRKFIPVACSSDGSRIGMFALLDGAAFQVLDSATGKVLMQPPLDPEKDSTPPVRLGALSSDGSKVLVIYHTFRRERYESLLSKVRPDLETTRTVHIQSLREYDVATGEITYERVLKEGEYYQTIVHTGQAWVLGGYGNSLYLADKTHTELTIPFARIDWVTPIPNRQDDALLVEYRKSANAVVTPDGKLLGTWYGYWLGPGRNGRNLTPMSGIAFNGKVFARRTGAGEIELRDAQTFDTIAWVHVLQQAQNYEWIVYTPDGYWDASPGAEKFVLVTRNGSAVTPADLQSRRAAALLKSRLPQ
ncbi:hypothetical protein C5Y96_21740 [Blastopirellula marina]|uniref:SLA1 homology domain-containing protein n=1 Tax=Blastopirellula marina TaxID=124 RepID=A0A2S8F1L8_9BACT|nr:MULTISPECIES: hypothetical protein [Pirellulaceae]PQO26075.1 hypothetical protein C5Y96_21740 [Blastopirellula marina]RCS44433.1 hypothetical protein DTL36_21785 [Bremerella cremea]